MLLFPHENNGDVLLQALLRSYVGHNSCVSTVSSSMPSATTFASANDDAMYWHRSFLAISFDLSLRSIDADDDAAFVATSVQIWDLEGTSPSAHIRRYDAAITPEKVLFEKTISLCACMYARNNGVILGKVGHRERVSAVRRC